MEERTYYSIIDICDELCASYFGVSIDLFIEVIDKRCNENEAEIILLPVLMSNGEGEFEESKLLFNSKLTKNEFKTIHI